MTRSQSNLRVRIEPIQKAREIEKNNINKMLLKRDIKLVSTEWEHQ